MRTTVPLPKFTEAEASAAWDEFRFNCGPSAVAVMTGLSIPELMPHLFDFPEKGYTNPTLMWWILDSIKGRAKWSQRKDRQWPDYGLARIQWHGPWMQAGVPVAARYRHTHWVGAMQCLNLGAVNLGVFDINAMSNGTGWVSYQDWWKGTRLFT